VTQQVVITSAEIAGAATIDLVRVGGGTQVVTVDGTPTVRTHPATTVYQVRFLSPDRMIPDELTEVATYDEACDLAVRYANKVQVHAERVAALAADLRM